MDFDEGHNRSCAVLMWSTVMIICGIAVLAITLPVDTTTLSVLSSSWGAADSFAEISVTALTGAQAAGGTSAFVGLLGIIAWILRNRPLAILGVTVGLLMGISVIVCAVLFSGLIADAKYVVIHNPYSNNPEFTATQFALSDFSNAVYNYCCQPVWTSTNSGLDQKYIDTLSEIEDQFQGSTSSCPTIENVSDEDYCPKLPDIITGISKIYPGAKDTLCTCFEIKSYAKISTYMNQNNVCAKLENVRIPVGAKKEIPETSLSLNSLLELTSLKAYLPIKEMPMVGYPGGENPVTLTPGFGCGLMHTKGIAWVQYEYLNNVGESVLLAYYVCGSIQTLVSVLLAVYWIMEGKGTNNDDIADYEAGQVSSFNPKSDF